MKLLAIITSFIIVANSRKIPTDIIYEWEAKVDPYFNECVARTNVDLQMARTVFRHANYPDEPDFHCYMHCIYEKLGIISANNEFDRYRMLQVIYSSTPELIQRCLNEPRGVGNNCKRAYDVAGCIIFSRAD